VNLKAGILFQLDLVDCTLPLTVMGNQKCIL